MHVFLVIVIHRMVSREIWVKPSLAREFLKDLKYSTRAILMLFENSLVHVLSKIPLEIFASPVLTTDKTIIEFGFRMHEELSSLSNSSYHAKTELNYCEN